MALLSCARTAFVDEVEEASVTWVPSIGAEFDGGGPSLSLVISVITYWLSISKDSEYVWIRTRVIPPIRYASGSYC